MMTVSFTPPHLQPDSEKSTSEHIGDKIKGKADAVASKVQPEVYRLSFIISAVLTSASESEVHGPTSQ
jgi:hypothetical protein